MQHTKRILLFAPSPHLIGGVPTWIAYVVPALVRAGWEVRVGLTEGRHHFANAYMERYKCMNYHVVSSPTGSREGRIRACVRAIRAARPDIVLVVNVVDAYEAAVRVRTASLPHLKVVMALHGLQTCYYEDLARLRLSLDAVIATNKLCVAAAATIAGLAPSRVMYAPCGVQRQETGRTMSHHMTKQDCLHLRFCGRLDNAEKRVFDLPLLLEKLEARGQAYLLEIAGSGPDAAELRARVQKFASKVKFVGVLQTSAEREQFYMPGSVLLVLSPTETGPLVAWEAMDACVAVVTSRFVGIALERGFVHNYNCLIFPVGDMGLAVDQICSLTNTGTLLRLVNGGRETVASRYTTDASASAWDDALKRVLGLPKLNGDSSYILRVDEGHSGRLDRILGERWAELVRASLGRKHVHRDVGGEWPHSYGAIDNDPMQEAIRRLDGQANNEAATIGGHTAL